MKMSRWTRKRIPRSVKLLADWCVCVRGENSMFHLKSCFSLLLLPPPLSLSLSLTPFSLPLSPFIYTCQEVAIKSQSLCEILLQNHLYSWKKNKSSVPSDCIRAAFFADLFRLITLTARQPLKCRCEKKASFFFFFPSVFCACFLSFSGAAQGPLSEC